METASGCPRRWCWSNRRTGATEGLLPCSWVEEGWLLSEREQRSRCRSLLPSAMFWEEQGTGESLPAALDRRSHRHPPGGGGASGRPPKISIGYLRNPGSLIALSEVSHYGIRPFRVFLRSPIKLRQPQLAGRRDVVSGRGFPTLGIKGAQRHYDIQNKYTSSSLRTASSVIW